MSPPFACFFCCFHTKTDYHRQIYLDTTHFTLYNGTFPICPQQRTGACKCHVIVVVLRLRVQKLTPADFRLFATQCGSTINSFCDKWEGSDPVNRFTNTTWVAIVTRTDHHKSVRNRCVIEVFGCVFV